MQHHHPRPAVKANRLRPYISGFHGQHSMEVGVAYWYRGHYLYGPARNPIEPIQFATKNNTMIMGTAAELASFYERSHWKYSTATLESVGERIFEHQVGALRKSMEYEWLKGVLTDIEKQQVGVEKGVEVEMQFEKTIDLPKSARQIIKPAMKLSQSCVLAPSPMLNMKKLHNLKDIKAPYRDPPYAAELPSVTQTDMARITDPAYARILNRHFTPEYHVRFLAESAAGSVHHTPQGLHHVQPILMSLPDSGALNPVASTSNFRHLLAEEGIKRQKLPISLGKLVKEGLDRSKIPHLGTGRKDQSDFAKYYCVWQTGSRLTFNFVAWTDQSTMRAYERTLSILSSREALKLYSKSPYPEDNRENIPPVGLAIITPEIQVDNPEHVIANQCDGGLGEEPYGKVTKCPLHGEECDGTSVAHDHLTEASRNGIGFQEWYPTVCNGGREMVDWFRIMDEEKMQRGTVRRG